MTLFRNKFRSESARLAKWDYSADGDYFITVCVQPQFTVFGTIKSAKIDLSTAGRIAHTLWQEMEKHYPEVEAGPFVVMPDHIHGIITIRKPTVSSAKSGQNHLYDKGHTLGNIVGSYKSAVTKMIKEAGIRDFRWQERFYDRIIRSDAEYRRIERYISENPRKWWEKHGSVPDPG